MPVAAVTESPHAVNVDSLVLRHDVVPTVLIDCFATAIPTISAQQFLDRPVLSDVAAYAHEPATARAILSHYHQAKSDSPHLSGLFVLPDIKNPSWQPLLKGMTLSEVLDAKELRLPCAQDGVMHQSQFIVYHDALRLLRGIVPVAALPRAIRALHVKDDSPGLTFVFDARAAGLRASVLWDSGAALSFVDSAFVKRHNLATTATDRCAELADGSFHPVTAQVSLKLKIQASVTEVTLFVMDLIPGFDIILGDDWSKYNGVLADYGFDPAAHAPGPKTVHAEATAANLLLRRSGHRLFRAHTVDESDAAVDDATGHCANLISARKAMRLLATPRAGCRPAFLVTVRAQALASGVTDSAAVQVEVDRILERFSDAFEPPSAAAERPGLTPEAVPVQADATPPNRPAFRISVKERAVLEAHIAEQLQQARAGCNPLCLKLAHLCCLCPSQMAPCACVLNTAL